MVNMRARAVQDQAKARELAALKAAELAAAAGTHSAGVLLVLCSKC